jgi:hypothetical protein
MKKYIGFRGILAEYYDELLKLCSEKTNLDFGHGFMNNIFPTNLDVVRLEQFIHKNNLFDTKQIFEKYSGKLVTEESLSNYMSIDNSRYREFNSQFSEVKINTSGNRGYGKSYAMIKEFLDYSGFEIIEPSKELKKTFDKINKEGDLFLCLKEKKKKQEGN